MKVCLINNLFGVTARGGAERVVADEALGLRAAGVDTVMLHSCNRGDEESRVCDGVVVRSIAPLNLFWYGDLARHSWFARFAWHFVDIANVFARRQMKKVLMNVQPDVVHTHNIMGLGFLLPRLVKRMGVRHVHTVHDVQLLHPSGLIVSGSGHRGYQRVMRWIMSSPDVVIFPSQFLADMHEQAGFFVRSKKVIVRNPVPVVQNVRVGNDDVVETKKQPSFLFVGQLEPHKGVRELLHAWQWWPSRPLHATLDIIGGGSMEDWLHDIAVRDHSIHVHGKKNRDDIFSFYAAARYVIFPSIVIENAPAVIGESFSVGVPVIAASVGGLPELVSDNETGFLFRVRDEEDMIRAFDRAMAALPLWSVMSQRVREIAVSLSREKHVAHLLEYYRN